MTAHERLDALRAYVAAYRFLNLTLPASCVADDDASGAWFLLHNGELRIGNGLTSNDPAYWPGDWDEATRSARTLDFGTAYGALLRFLKAYAERGASDPLLTAIAWLAVTDGDGLPTDAALCAAWQQAWSEAGASTSEEDMIRLTGPAAPA